MVNKPILTLALGLLDGVVECQDVANGTGSPGVELIALVGLGMVIHGQGGVAATVAHPRVPVHEDNVPQLTGTLTVLFIAPTIAQPRPEGGTRAG